MPQLGLGTFQSNDAALCEQTILEALKVGYRLIDTAQGYGNEKYIGNALARTDVPREELFIVTKVWFRNHEDCRRSILQSMADLRVDYLDLVLIHWPFGDTYRAWRDMEALYAEGKIRAIGVSNYNADRLIDLIQYNKVVPAVNQIETNLQSQQQENREWMEKLGVQHMGYGPFGQGRINDIYDDPALTAIAAKYDKTSRQVVLRFMLQMGVVLIPKTVNPARLRENIDIFDFELTPTEMQTLSRMDKSQPLIGNPQNPALVESSAKWG
ncbi:aldo/keto reductase [Proteiniphilum sp. X52]|uniref:aldo/keto reductase n=1 Tax=Proteiniphilum sp. X52 TaxID=2382159 RepID=UPI002101CC49|nr:aldo/keto reductase [Proteiniphilum sp. X52]